MRKINFSGGEPFLPDRGMYLGELCKFCKEIGIEIVSIISNGSLITEVCQKRRHRLSFFGVIGQLVVKSLVYCTRRLYAACVYTRVFMCAYVCVCVYMCVYRYMYVAQEGWSQTACGFD